MLVIAHGLVSRSDLPIPEWLFGWIAAVVLIVSFAALAVLWPQPRLQHGGPFRPFPAVISRVVGGRAVAVLCGATGAGLLGLTVYAGLAGTQVPTANFAPTFVFVVVWVGFMFASVLFGDVFSAFNPWRAIGRAAGSVAARLAGGRLPAPSPYPARLGYLPAAAGLFAFAALELVDPEVGSKPSNVAIATLVYSACTFVAMTFYGVEAWCRRGEAFSVYFNLFARISPVAWRDGRLGLRLPLAGLAGVEPGRGLVVVLAVMIGTVSFDGVSEAPLWTGMVGGLTGFFESLGLGPAGALRATFALGLVACPALVYCFYELGIRGARSLGGNLSSGELAAAFASSLVPIAAAYVAAHYFTYLLYQGQAMWFLASNPLGEAGVDLFGTAGRGIDYGVLSATAGWYWQVGFVVAGHVAALAVAHDRALVLYSDPRLAVRSQYWMLAVMLGFTSLALWLLSQSNV